MSEPLGGRRSRPRLIRSCSSLVLTAFQPGEEVTGLEYEYQLSG